VKVKVLALAVGLTGILLAWWGVATLLYYRSFTETAEGVVDRRDDKEVVVRFHEERSAPAPQEVRFSGDAEYAFPVTDRTAGLRAGDKVTGYHPPGRLPDVRLDKDFPYLLPGGSAVAGAVLAVAAGAVLIAAGRKKRL
jgi:hypothetical protein